MEQHRLLRRTIISLLSITFGVCSATAAPVLHTSTQQAEAPTIDTSNFVSPKVAVGSKTVSRDYFWRDAVIGSVSIAIGQLVGVWVGSSGLESPVRPPDGVVGAILFVLATAIYLFGFIWLIRAVIRKIKSNKRERRKKKAGQD